MFLILSKICDFGSIDRGRVSCFEILSCLWSNILVRYITALFLLSIKGLSLDLYLNSLSIDNKSGVSWDFNQRKKVGYC